MSGAGGRRGGTLSLRGRGAGCGGPGRQGPVWRPAECKREAAAGACLGKGG